MRRFIVLCNLFVISKQIPSNLCERNGHVVCCPGFVLNSAEDRCIPCQDGYFGRNCVPCPASYFGNNCASKCNCSDEQCHHVHGCVTPQSPWKKERTTVSSSREQKTDTVTITNGHSIKGETTEASTRHSLRNNTDPIGVRDIFSKQRLHKCSHRRKHWRFANSVLFTISAYFTAISGLFVVLYFGLVVYKFKADRPSAV